MVRYLLRKVISSRMTSFSMQGVESGAQSLPVAMSYSFCNNQPSKLNWTFGPPIGNRIFTQCGDFGALKN